MHSTRSSRPWAPRGAGRAATTAASRGTPDTRGRGGSTSERPVEPSRPPRGRGGGRLAADQGLAEDGRAWGGKPEADGERTARGWRTRDDLAADARDRRGDLLVDPDGLAGR